MARNLELKVPAVDLGEVRAAAARLGARLEGTMRQVDTYFAVPEGRLKLREVEGGPAELISYRRPNLAGSRLSAYHLCPVTDSELLKTCLTEALGMRVVVDKRRELWLWEHTRIHLDQIAGLGTFVELETVITHQTDAHAEAELNHVAGALGLAAEQAISGSYSDLILEAGSP